MIRLGDCLDVMRELAADSIDAIVTDPPYGLEFMGHGWDRLSDQPGYVERGRITDRPDAVSAYSGAGGRAVNSYQAGVPMQGWHYAWAVEALRVAKPGAHLLAFGGTRTVHRLTVAIEDAGWEIRDLVAWAYASGFPKSLDISKAIDRAAGAVRPVTGPVQPGCTYYPEPCLGHDNDVFSPTVHAQQTGPATEAAAAWQGWGTALKPAWEPVVLARKPFRRSVVANVLEHGTGGLNIAAARLPVDPEDPVNGAVFTSRPSAIRPGTVGFVTTNTDGARRTADSSERGGRWPANLMLTDPIFDGGWEGVEGGGEASQSSPFRSASTNGDRAVFSGGPGAEYTGRGFTDRGTYSRFFLVPKAGRAERERGLSKVQAARLEFGEPAPADPELLEGTSYVFAVRVCNVCGNRTNPPGRPGELSAEEYPACGHADYRMERPIAKSRLNHHPTVKPVELMRHLVRLVTPPGGTVLDPFLGSGTTGIAAELEGFAWIGIERDAEYVEIARARVAGWAPEVERAAAARGQSELGI